ncbi:uncharacterized protein kif20ba [Menidia menidia]
MSDSVLINNLEKAEDVRRDVSPEPDPQVSCLEDRDHLRVFLRIRPLTPAEVSSGESQDSVTIEPPDKVLLRPPSSSLTARLSAERSVPHTGQRFQFSQVFGPESSQRDVFGGAVRGLVSDVLQGGNALLFTYGVSNAGKTFTFLGPEADVGLLPRSLALIFRSIEGRVFSSGSLKPQRRREFLLLSREEQEEEEALRRSLLGPPRESEKSSSSLLNQTNQTLLEGGSLSGEGEEGGGGPRPPALRPRGQLLRLGLFLRDLQREHPRPAGGPAPPRRPRPPHRRPRPPHRRPRPPTPRPAAAAGRRRRRLHQRPALGSGAQRGGGLQSAESGEKEPEFLLNSTQPAVQQEPQYFLRPNSEGRGRSHPPSAGGQREAPYRGRVRRGGGDRVPLPFGPGVSFSVWVSFCEIYNESIHDLLEAPPPPGGPAPSTTGGPAPPTGGPAPRRPALRLLQDAAGAAFIKDLRWVQVHSAEEAYRVLKVGKKNQSLSSTRLNQLSSRSHSIFSVRILRVEEGATPRVQAVSELCLCDLAGSERCARTQTRGERLKEAGNINTSLLILGKCIKALRMNQQARLLQHVPFRESKLTHYLQAFLIGRARACMLVNVSPSAAAHDETLNVLRLSAVAQKVVILSRPPSAPPQGSRGSQVGGESSLEDVQEEDMSLSEDEDQSEGEDPQTPAAHIRRLALTLRRERAENMLLENRVREEISQEFCELFSAMQRDYDERLDREKQILEERAERRMEIFQKLISDMQKLLEADAHSHSHLRRQLQEALASLQEEKKVREEAQAVLEEERRSREEAQAALQEERRSRKEALASLEEEKKAREETQASLEEEKRSREEAQAVLEEERRAKQEAQASLQEERRSREEAQAALKLQTLGKEEAQGSLVERRAKEEALASLQEEKKAKEEALASLQEERRSREEALASLQEERRSREEALASLEEEKRSREEALASLEEERRSREEAQADLKLQTLGKEEAQASLQEEEKKAKEEAQAALEEERRSREEAQTALEEAQAALEEERRAKQEAQASLQEERRSREEAQASLVERRAKEEALASLQEEKKAKEEALASLEEERRSREEALASLEEERKVREEERRSREEALASLEEERKVREEERRSREEVEESLRQELRKLSDKVENSEQQLEQLRGGLVGEEKETQTAQKRVQQLEEELRRRKEELGQLTELGAERRRELLAVAHEAVALKEAELERREEELRGLRERVGALTLDLQRSQQEASDLREQLSDYRKQVQQVQTQVAAMREEGRGLRGRLGEAERRGKQLQEQLTIRDRSLQLLRAEVAALKAAPPQPDPPKEDPQPDPPQEADPPQEDQKLYQKALQDLEQSRRVVADMRLALTEQEETQQQMEGVLEEKLRLLQELSSELEELRAASGGQRLPGQSDELKLAKQEAARAQDGLKTFSEKHQAERRKWLEEKLSLIGQAKEAEDKRNQEMRKFAEDRERSSRQQNQLEAQLQENRRTLEAWRADRDALVQALEVQLQKLLSSQKEKDQLIQQLQGAAPPPGEAEGSQAQKEAELQEAQAQKEAELQEAQVKKEAELQAAQVKKEAELQEAQAQKEAELQEAQAQKEAELQELREELRASAANQQAGNSSSPPAAVGGPHSDGTKQHTRASVSSRGSSGFPSLLESSQENGRASRFPRPELEISFSPLQPNRMALRRHGEDAAVTVKISRAARKRKSGEMEKSHIFRRSKRATRREEEVEAENRRNTRTKLAPTLAAHPEESSSPSPGGRGRKDGALQKINDFLHSSPTLLGSKAKRMMGLVTRGGADSPSSSSSPSSSFSLRGRRRPHRPQISSPMDMPPHPILSRNPEEKEAERPVKWRLRSRK